jgi:hypothetical protein
VPVKNQCLCVNKRVMRTKYTYGVSEHHVNNIREATLPPPQRMERAFRRISTNETITTYRYSNSIPVILLLYINMSARLLPSAVEPEYNDRAVING